MSEHVDVDKIWISLGKWGYYQKRQLIVLLVAIWSCGFHMLSIVFIAYRPSFECKAVKLNVSAINGTEETYYSRSYGKCSVTHMSNISGDVSVKNTDCADGWYYYEDEAFDEDRSIISEWDLVCSRKELAELSQTLVMIGQGIGAFVFTSLADKYGRKPVHILCHAALFIFALCTAFVPNYPSFAAMRTLLGAVQQGTGLAQAILSLEMFPKEIRGYVEVLGLLFWTTGIAIVTPIAYIFRNISWRYFQICLACLSSWSLIEWWLIDESLRWLIANGKYEEAKRILLKACKMNKKDFKDVVAGSGFLEHEMKSVKQHNKEHGGMNKKLLSNGLSPNGMPQEDAKSSIKAYTVIDLVKSKRLFISSMILWFAWMTNSLTYYGIMLISSSLAGNRFLNFFLGSVVEYPAAFMEYVMINRYGRKPTVIIFHVICGVALITATIINTCADGNSSMVLTATVFTLIGKFAITGSFSTIFLYTPELYPTNMRNTGIGMSSAAARIGGMLAPFSRNLAESLVWGPGLVFGVMCAIVSVSMLWIPETNQYELPQTLEECETWYKENRLQLPCGRSRRRTEQTIEY
ncbi:organic cation transporter protein-like [Mya arenaria]|uniref:organic cation transporter protein-like n=1 Tax=Mya arenaria TaxID=6604 RepID=UPI0022E1E90A|nr:organic cation transporter protein-like [Mya arenaria]